MKQFKQKGFGPVLVLVTAVIVIALGFAGWQLSKKYGNSGSKSTAGSNNCGEDRQCFYESYNNCTEKTIKVTRTTVEGANIITDAKLSSTNEGCIIYVTVDGSQDKFGDGKIHNYTCKTLTQNPNELLTASECTGTSEATSVDI